MNTDPRPCRRADGMGKIGFSSKRSVKRYLKKLRARVGHEGATAYRCPACRLWHFGR